MWRLVGILKKGDTMTTNQNIKFDIDTSVFDKDIKNIKELLQIELVTGIAHESIWDKLIEKYHYLGSAKVMGPRLKYIVWYKNQPVSAIGFNQAVYKIGARERFINWSEEEKKEVCPA